MQRCPLAAATKIRAPGKSLSSPEGYRNAGVRQKERAKTSLTSPCFLRAPPRASVSVPNQKQAPQATVPGQANGPLSQKDGGVFCLLSVQCPRSGSQPRTISLTVTVSWDPGAQVPWPPRTRQSKGISWGGSHKTRLPDVKTGVPDV